MMPWEQSMGKKEKFAVYILLAVLLAVSAAFLAIKYRNKMLSLNKVLVYFVNYDEEQQKPYLAPVIREIAPAGDVEDKLRTSIEELFKGPSESEKEKGITSAMPEKARLLNLRIQQGVAYLDFSKEIEEGGGSLLMLERLAQIVFTATQFSPVKSVRMQVEGSFIEYFSGEGITDVALPMGRDNFNELFR